MFRKKNKMLYVVLLLPVMLMSIDYNLNNYRVPDYVENELNFNLNTGGNFSTEDTDDRITSKNMFDVEYLMDKYSRRNILNLRGAIGLDYYHNEHVRNDSTKYEWKNPKLSGEFNLGADIRRYIAGEWFCSAGVDFSAKPSYTETHLNDFDSKSTDERNNESYSESGKFGIGYGRIQNVSQACQALEILSELEQEGLLKREVTSEDIESLADELVNLKNQHYFDYRLHRKEELRQIVGVLESRGLLDASDFDSFLIMMDLNSIDYVFVRESGWDIYPEFEIYNHDLYSDIDEVYKVEYDSTKSVHKSKGTSEYNEINYQVNLKLNYCWIFNTNWQVEASSSYGLIWGNSDKEYDEVDYFVDSERDSSKTIEKEEQAGYTMDFDLMVSWYPNTRTRLWLNLNYNLIDKEVDHKDSYESDLEYEDDEYIDMTDDYFYRRYQINTGMDYYISPQFSIYLNLTYKDENFNSDYESNTFNYCEDDNVFSFSLKMNYSLF